MLCCEGNEHDAEEWGSEKGLLYSGDCHEMNFGVNKILFLPGPSE